MAKNYASSSRNMMDKTSRRLVVRITDKEYNFLLSKAKQYNWSVAKYVVEKLFHVRRNDIVTNSDIQSLIKSLVLNVNELKAIGRNINQIAYRANLEHKYLEEQSLKNYLFQLEHQVRKLEKIVGHIK